MNTGTAKVGVLIVTFNSEADISTCLDSVKAASSSPVHVVVVDNASADKTAALIEQSNPTVTLIRNSENRYYAAANNQGLPHALRPFVLLLNPDVVLPVGGIDAMVQLLDSRPSHAAVAPMLQGGDGRRQASLREFPGLDTLWFDLLGLSFLFPHSRSFGRWRMGYFDGKALRDVQQPMASCLLIRRDVLTALGLFDERFPMFFNDVDWCRRVQDAGWKILYTPDIIARHRGGASTRQRKLQMIWMSHSAYYRYLRLYECCDVPGRIALWATAPFLFLAAILRTLKWLLIPSR
ncbi:MAG: glycosyltransferase family 2 protein [candidate division Zixibacteria bacterium]|nr:glycosyltransferase family 2 protein [candidate division Zixibacteria bacterium]